MAMLDKIYGRKRCVFDYVGRCGRDQSTGNGRKLVGYMCDQGDLGSMSRSRTIVIDMIPVT